MPRKSKLKLPPLDLGHESFGQRLARVRKERGYTQVELAHKIGIIQVLVSDYEHDRLRMHTDMLARFAFALEVSADELLGLSNAKASKQVGGKISLKLVRRLQKVEQLPSSKQKALLQTIDMFLQASGLSG